MDAAPAAFALRIETGGQPAAQQPPPSPRLAGQVEGLVKLEQLAARTNAERAAAAATLEAATAAAAAAAATAEKAVSEADACKDKNAKTTLVTEAEAAEAAAAHAEAARAEAAAAHAETQLRDEEVRRAMRRQHTMLASEMLLDETQTTRAAFGSILAETGGVITEALVDHERYGADMRRFEASQLLAEAMEEERAVRDRLDPTYERDCARAIVDGDLHGRPIRAGIGGIGLFGQPPPTGKLRLLPEPSAPLPRHVKLSRVAKYCGEDRVVVDKGTQRAASVRIRAVELGDRALPPRPILDEPEAVYLVEQVTRDALHAPEHAEHIRAPRRAPRSLGGAPRSLNGPELPSTPTSVWSAWITMPCDSRHMPCDRRHMPCDRRHMPCDRRHVFALMRHFPRRTRRRLRWRAPDPSG